MERIGARRLAMISMMAAVEVVFDSILTLNFSAGVWYGLVFLMSPIAGILLGPIDGFLATLIAVMVGHTLSPRGAFEYAFTFGAPLCSMISGYVYRGKVKVALAYYLILFLAYFATPVTWYLPLWGIWDTLSAFILTVILTALSYTGRTGLLVKKWTVFAFAAFIGLEADILFRIFLFIPCGTYWLFYGLTREALYAIWSVPAPLITPFKVLVSTFFTAALGPAMEKALKLKAGWLPKP
ncbi:hypothetical protein J7L06_07465 [Candidatus Bathyarchaeota archaeon]|nr:hypothetical protein [Candidatus Bathyarchaeota archaeon]